jgi:anion-transporting  ArsA/GET3 family ATPase
LSTLLNRLGRRQLLVVTGKGGVGKSALTAALGLILAGAGRKVLLLEVDPRESLYALLDLPPSGGGVVRAVPGLWVQNLRPREVLDRMVREQVRLGLIADRVLASPVYEQFAEGAPGLKEMAVVAHAQRVVQGRAGRELPDLDLVVLDAPATGHGLSLLGAPLLVSEVIHDGPVGHQARKLAGFVSDPSRCAVLVATLAEEMPAQEALELIAAVENRFSRGPDLLLVNGLYPALRSSNGAAGAGDEPWARLWRERRAVNDRELRRLDEAWKGTRIDLPMLPAERGPDLVAGLQETLEAELRRRP